MLYADTRTIPNGWMIDKRVPAGAITRQADGFLRVVCPDGTTDLVAGHRVDLAQMLACGLITPQRRAKAPARPAQAPPGCGFSAAQVRALEKAVTPLLTRLRDLEKGKGKAPPPLRPSANVHEAKARAQLALARARTALQRTP